MWEVWEAGSMAFHAFRTLSFPWPTFIGRTSNIEVAEDFGLRDIKPSQAQQCYETLNFPEGDVAVLII